MSVGKINDLVSDEAIAKLDQLIQKLGIATETMATATRQAAEYTAAVGNTRSIAEFQTAQDRAIAATQGVISSNNTIITQQKEIAAQTQATADAIKNKVVQDENASAVLKQVGGSLDANIKLLIQQKLELKSVNDELKDLNKQYAGSSQSQNALAAKTAVLTKEQISLKEAIASQNLLIRQQVKENNAAGTSQDANLARLNQLRKAYNSLSEEEVKNIAVGGVLIKEINALATATSEANVKQGKFNDNVGNYESGFAKAGKAVGGFLTPIRQLAYILPGIGMAGLFNLAFEALGALISNFDLFKEKVTSAKAILDSFNSVNKEANQTYAKESTELKVLYGAATDVNNSMQGRLDAARELQKDWPKTFANFTSEQIITGQVKKGYDDLTASLYENAKARAALAKIEKLAADNLDAEFTKQKIDNAAEAEKKRVPNLVVQRNLGTNSDALMSTPKSVLIAEANKVIEDRKEASKKVQDARIKINNDQIDFLTKMAGGNNALASGLGAGDNGKKDNANALKDAKQLNNDELELQRAKLEGEKQTAKLILDDNQQSYEARLAALKIYVERSKAIIGTENEIADRTPGITGVKKQVNAQNSKNQIGQVDNFNLQQQQKINAERIADQKAANEEILKEYKALEQRREEMIQDGLNTELLDKDAARSVEMLKLSEQYAKGEIREKEYRSRINSIRKKAAAEAIDIEIAALQEILKVQEENVSNGSVTSKQVQATQNRITGLKIRSNDLKSDSAAANSKGDIDGFKEKAKEALKFSNELVQGLDIANGLIQANANAKIDALEKEFQLIQQNGEAEKTRIGDSILSSKEKAREQKIIDAQVAQQRIRITQLENQEKRKAAEFDKAAAIAKIIQAGAVAVVEALPNVVLAAIVGGLAAAQLAVAIATPLPQFFKGTKNAPEGLAHVGELGTELQINPDGSMGLTPSTDTVTYLKKGTQIIPHHELMQMFAKPEQINYVGGTFVDNKKLEKLMQESNDLKRREKRTTVVKIMGDKFGTYANRNY